MLIIFDLDDTLIDTTGSITPFQLKKALKELVSEGLYIKNFNKALELLLLLNKKSDSAAAALKIFFKEIAQDDKFYLLSLKKIYNTFPKDCKVFPVPHSLKTIELLSKKYKLALVSYGIKDIQLYKMEKAGIDTSFFCKIKITSTKDKKKYFEAVVQEFSLEGEKVIVCGDKVDIDLMPAKQIGCTTVLMRWGRGINQPINEWVDFSISALPELHKILEEL